WGGIFACALAITVTGLAGLILVAFSRSTPKPVRAPKTRPVRHVGAAPVVAERAVETRQDQLHVPTSEGLTVMPQAWAEPQAVTAQAAEAETVSLFASAPAAHHAMPASLEPAIFHDNASDSFLSREPQAAFDPNDVLSERHGLIFGHSEPVPES